MITTMDTERFNHPVDWFSDFLIETTSMHFRIRCLKCEMWYTDWYSSSNQKTLLDIYLAALSHHLKDKLNIF